MKTSDKILTAESYISLGVKLAKQAQQELKEMKQECEQSDISLTNEQAARILGVSPRTVTRMKADGRLESTSYLDVQEYYKKTRQGRRALTRDNN